jgi:methyl-accepting chemotaxis protein
VVGARRLADLEGQVKAVSKSQAVIEFNMDGTLRTASDNFLNAVGYTLREIRSQHHSLFIDPAGRDSAQYRSFCAKLGRGYGCRPAITRFSMPRANPTL